MAATIGAIQVYDEAEFGYPGDNVYRVDSGTTASISAGTPVAFSLGVAFVAAAADGVPVVGTDFLGIAATTSNETASLPGTVAVTKFVNGMSWLIAPKTASSWDTQAEYDALVGDRVTLDLTTGVWTIDATDSATYGCVVLPLDISKFPGKVRFAFRNAVNYLT